MMPQKIYLATAAAAFLYVISPGPAFLALFALAASKGRTAGAWFISGHLVGDITWGALAFAAIIGVNQVGPVLFELLGAGCGTYLIYLGVKAVMTKKDAPPRTVGARRPLLAGMMFGLTNPKAYPVAVAMFTAIAAPFAGQLTFADAPRLVLAAFAGFLTADMVLIFAAGLPAVLGVLFIAFGAKSIFDAANGALRREA
jgi:threonine/homoserine/homoserine lactone efflux protein